MPGVHITAVEGVFTGHSNDDIRHNQRPPFSFLLFGVYTCSPKLLILHKSLLHKMVNS